MSNVVEARECRICACASFTSAPAIVSQVAWEVRKQRQFTQGIPNARAAGLMNRVSTFLSRSGFPSCICGTQERRFRSGSRVRHRDGREDIYQRERGVLVEDSRSGSLLRPSRKDLKSQRAPRDSRGNGSGQSSARGSRHKGNDHPRGAIRKSERRRRWDLACRTDQAAVPNTDDFYTAKTVNTMNSIRTAACATRRGGSDRCIRLSAPA
jgi:hypothetical protein